MTVAYNSRKPIGNTRVNLQSYLLQAVIDIVTSFFSFSPYFLLYFLLYLYDHNHVFENFATAETKNEPVPERGRNTHSQRKQEKKHISNSIN